MYGFILTRLILLFILTTCWFVHWYNKPVYVQHNTCKIEDLVDNPESIEIAVRKMGSGYNYVISPDGTLRVNKGDGVWLVLKY